MNILRKYIPLAIFVLTVSVIQAQTKCDWSTIDDASEKYKSGNFEQVIESLEGCIQSGFDDKQKVQAYRLIAKTQLELDNDSLAQLGIASLLRIDPEFQPDYLSDPTRFIEILDNIKAQNSALLVTSVSKKSENVLEAPATVVVITEKNIKERGYTNIEEIFHDLPGFDVIRGRGPAYSLMYQRGYRSITNDRTILLIDGIEENDLASDNMPISRQFPLSHIKRIEYVYGPSSTMYGANAFVGVINVVTKKNNELFSGNNKLAVDARLNYGSMNSKLLDATIAGRTKNISFSITGRYFDTDDLDISSYDDWNLDQPATDYAAKMDISGENGSGGYNAQDYLNSSNLDVNNTRGLYTITRDASNTATNINLTQAGINRARLNDSLALYSSGGELPSVKKNDNYWYIKARIQTEKFTVGFQSWRNDEGLAPWYTDNRFIFRENRSRWISWNSLLYANYESTLGNKVYFTNLLSYRNHEIEGGTNFESFIGYFTDKLSFAELANDSIPSISTTYYYRTSNQLRNESRIIYTPNNKFNLLAGLELRSSMIQGDYLRSGIVHPDETASAASQKYLGSSHFRTYDAGLFAQFSYKVLPSLTFILGGRGDYNKIRSTGGYGLVFNPRAVLVYTPKNFIFKAIYSEAFKDASYLQRYSTTQTRLLNNPGLKPEEVKNYELSAYAKINDYLNLSVVGYSAFYSNAVKSVTVDYNGVETQRFENLGVQEISGVQSEMNIKLGDYRLSANYTYTLPTDKKAELRISDIAAHKVNFIANALFYKYYNLNIRVNYVGERETGENTSGSLNPISKFEPYYTLNSTFFVSGLVKNLSMSLSVNNILDKEYFVPGIRDADGVTYASKYPQFGRTVYLSIMYKI